MVRPVLTILPTSGWGFPDPGELWAFRDLLLFLAWRDITIRYKQTLFGVAWAVLQPFLTMILFTVVFGRLAGLPSDGLPYPLFAYSGLILWTFLSGAVTASGNSLVGSAHLITKVYFPRVVVPAAAVGATLVDLLWSGTVLVGMMAWYGYLPGWNVVFLPLFLFLLVVLSFGAGLWLSALNVSYRDVRYALPFIIQFWMFASPVIFPLSIIPSEYRWLMALNPATGAIEGFRAALFGLDIDWAVVGISAAVTAVLLLHALLDFRRMERTFADVV